MVQRIDRKCTYKECTSLWGVYIGQRCRKHKLPKDEAYIIRRLKYATEKICLYCKHKFWIQKSRLNDNNTRGKFCSFNCRSNAQYKRVARVCFSCKKIFSVKPSRLKTGRGKFCSRKCLGIHMSLQIGPNTPHWKGIKIHLNRIRCSRRGKEWRQEIRARNACEFCTSTEELHAHHVKGLYSIWINTIKETDIQDLDYNDDRFHDIKNGLLVCKKCHQKLHPLITVLRS